MIYGVGTDLLKVERIHAAFLARGERFARRILGEDEFKIFQSRYQRNENRGLLFLATRFAAKEAFSKAIGLGLRSPMSWGIVQFVNAPSGKPMVKLSEPLLSWCAERRLSFHVSMTDESDMVCAFVVAEIQANETQK
ncbi:holo-ACP synthase [Hydromonas duriensis]|uniref:Holo-[acyl-carrier-protein] synthase n=1 Tax=Hydromonas duriensis TaxID=1527608 RepID=A0A4R6Y8F8_9BURK|nr:holo-ACP synthase [Hydromonas duriensis]TDR31689.1 holo-[acyl-carrier protein] synthase [Hydromonas duriensis]